MYTSAFKILLIIFLPLMFCAGSCQKASGDTELTAEYASVKNTNGNIEIEFPAQDPGGPFYMRMGGILNQMFVSDGWLVIPFYREPDCVPADFNLLTIFDPPAAFSCPLTFSGRFIIEAGAAPGTFPIIVHSKGDAVPFWFARMNEVEQAAADGVLTITELQALDHLEGVADQFSETLKPRMENHLVQINASGILHDGKKFSFHVTHVGDKTTSIGLTL